MKLTKINEDFGYNVEGDSLEISMYTKSGKKAGLSLLKKDLTDEKKVALFIIDLLNFSKTFY